LSERQERLVAVDKGRSKHEVNIHDPVAKIREKNPKAASQVPRSPMPTHVGAATNYGYLVNRRYHTATWLLSL
jgi:hypothetical protein